MSKAQADKIKNERDEDLGEEIEGSDQDELEEGTPAADTLKTSKVDIIGQVVTKLGEMPINDLSKWFTDTIGPADTSTTPDASAKNKASTQMKGDATKAVIGRGVREDVDALFSGQKLDEEFRGKAVTLFEAAVNARVAAERLELEEEAAEQAEAIREEISEQVRDTIEYLARQWTQENQVAIENSLRVEHASQLMDALKGLLQEHYVEIPDDKTDVLESLSDRVEELTDRLNDETERNIELTNENTRLTIQKVFDEESQGLALTDKEKFKTLVETIDFQGDVEDLRTKLQTVREGNFKDGSAKPTAKKTEDLTEEVVVVVEDKGDEPKKPTSPQMQVMLEALRRSSGNSRR